MYTTLHRYTFITALVLLLASIGGLFAPALVMAQTVGSTQTSSLGAATAQVKNAGTTQNPDFGCWSIHGFGFNKISSCFAALTYWIMVGAAGFAGIVSVILNYAVMELVVGMGIYIGNIPGIVVAWEVLRDIVNVFLVFLTVYIGIATILGVSGYGYQKMLWKVVIAALFVNFSMTFTKVVIDVSNLAAMQLYQNLLLEGEGSMAQNVRQCMSPMKNSDSIAGDKELCITNGIASVYWGHLMVTTLFNPQGNLGANTPEGTMWNLAWVHVLGTILFIVMAFVFGGMAFMLIGRFLTLIFLLIASPVALTMWFTGVSGVGKDWWNRLLRQSFFAPAMFLMLWIALKIIQGMKGRFNIDGGLGGSTALTMNWIAALMYFIIVMGSIVAALVVAQKMGAHGATAVISTGQRLARSVAGGLYALGPGMLANQALKGYNRGLAYRENRRTQQDEEHERQVKAATERRDSARAAGDMAAVAKATDELTKLQHRKNLRTTGRVFVNAAAGTGGFLDRRISGGLKKAADFSYGGAESYTQVKAAQEKREKEIATGARAVEAGQALDAATTYIEYANMNDKDRRDALTKKGITGTQQDEELKKINAAFAKIGQLTNNDLGELHDKIMKNPEIAGLFSAEQLEQIFKSDKYSDTERDVLRKSKFKDVFEAAATSDRAAMEKAVESLSEKEAELLGDELHANQLLIESLPEGHVEKLMTSSRVSGTRRTAIKATRTAYYNQLIDGKVPGKTIGSVMGKMKPTQIAKMHGDILTRPEAMDEMNVGMLPELAKSLNSLDRGKIRSYVHTEAAPLRTGFDAEMTRRVNVFNSANGRNPSAAEERAIYKQILDSMGPPTNRNRRLIEMDDFLNSPTAGSIF